MDLCFIDELNTLSIFERKHPLWVVVNRAGTDSSGTHVPAAAEMWEELGHVEEGMHAVIENKL